MNLYVSIIISCLCASLVSGFQVGFKPVWRFKAEISSRTSPFSEVNPRRLTSLCLGAKKRAWAKGDLSEKDIFADDQGTDGDPTKKKNKFKLDPEVTYFEGPPAPVEMLFPAISILTVIGIVPFISSVARQLWVRYKFTSRRISLQSGFGGKEVSEIIYPDIAEIRFVYRAFGASGDMVLFLKDGAKAEMRFVPNFKDIYNYVLSKCDEECQAKSMKLESDEKSAQVSAAK